DGLYPRLAGLESGGEYGGLRTSGGLPFQVTRFLLVDEWCSESGSFDLTFSGSRSDWLGE
ncbi:MAG: hypothetical protein ACQKBT_13010, partial [Puniceicoccales bacterium]